MGDATVFAGLDSLVELTVYHVSHCETILENIYPQLKRFAYMKKRIVKTDSIRNPAREQTLETLSTFISRHKTMKTLELDFNCYDYESAKAIILQEIGNSSKELVELKICIGLMDDVLLQPLQALKWLRTLSLSDLRFKDFQFFSALIELRELKLSSCVVPKDSDQFTTLTKLTKLDMEACYTDGVFDVVGIISRLVNLKELDIFGLDINPGRFVLDEKSFSKIVATIKERPNVLTLKCNFGFNFNLKSFDKIKLIKEPY